MKAVAEGLLVLLFQGIEGDDFVILEVYNENSEDSKE